LDSDVLRERLDLIILEKSWGRGKGGGGWRAAARKILTRYKNFEIQKLKEKKFGRLGEVENGGKGNGDPAMVAMNLGVEDHRLLTGNRQER